MRLREGIQSKSAARGKHALSAITAVYSEKIEFSAEIKVECAFAFSRGKGGLVFCLLFVLILVCALGDPSRHVYQQPVKNSLQVTASHIKSYALKLPVSIAIIPASAMSCPLR